MHQKFKLLAALTLASAAFASHSAFAADGTITFTGSVTANTCAIAGNGASSKNFTVALPNVSNKTLAAAGDTAGRTPFSIALTGCTPNTGNVHTFFEAGPTVDTASGNLINTSTGGAANVQIGLLNADASAIKAGATDASQNSKAVALAGGNATLQYIAQYVATGATTAGAVNSSVQYTIVYP